MGNKTALVFHGGLGRAAEQMYGLPMDCYHGLKSIEENLGLFTDCDVFLHAWEHESSENLLKYLKPRAALITSPYQYKILDVVDLIFLSRTRGWRPFFHDIRRLLSNVSRENERIKSIFSRWLSASLALQLFATNSRSRKCEYDWVILLRYDVEFFNRLDLKQLDPKKVYLGNSVRIYDNKGLLLPNSHYWRAKNKKNLTIKREKFTPKYRGLEDFFIIGSPDNIISLSSVYNNIKTLLKTGTKMNNHHILEAHLTSHVGLENIDFYKERMTDFDLARRRHLQSVE